MKNEDIFSKKKVEEFQDEILNFYYESGRHHLNFRQDKNPYFVHISEIMLSQTQVDRVEKYFEKWIEKYPTIQDVANSTKTELLQMWQGLGYNSRVLNFKQACQQLIEEFNGKYPKDKKELMKLKGVGPYVASAICAFSFNQTIGVVDTNVRRILIYFNFANENMKTKELEEVAQKLVPKDLGKDWTNALMDYGALKLTAKKSGIKSISKQGKFIGSSRYIRSFIIKECLKNQTISISDIELECRKYNLNYEDIISKLEKEKIIQILSNKIILIE